MLLQLLLLSLLSLLPLASSQVATTPATLDSPFENVEDACKQCIDIPCYAPVDWRENKLEVCRYKKNWICKKEIGQVCRDVPVETCKVVGYAKCEHAATEIQVRDDEVASEYFKEWDCKHEPITLIEKKQHPHCINETKTVCEKMWVPEAPFWKDVNCQELEWQNCELIEKRHPVQIDYCPCQPTETWYDKLVPVDTVVTAHSTTCSPEAVIECSTTTQKSCATVEYENCIEEVEKVCHEQHFRIPTQTKDHRRWCSHVEIEIPRGIPRTPDDQGVDTCAAPDYPAVINLRSGRARTADLVSRLTLNRRAQKEVEGGEEE